ncbi:MAG: prolyl oligopeptidase family serine peptidase [Alphaproteobacteria bacterium]|nr:prolyl oligopeptidase family serine peptidase [Alphaproteobacteria bacterium]
MSVSRQFGLLSAIGFLATGQFLLPSAAAADSPRIPQTPAKVVVDTFHGQKVADPYRWLEQAGDPAVKMWSDAQNVRTHAYLDALPTRGALKQKLTKLIGATSPNYYGLRVAGNQVFAMFNQPPKQQPMLAVMPATADPAASRIVVDPNKLNAKGTTTIDWFVPSHSGKLVAASLSDNGSEDGAVHVFDVATGKQVGEVVPRVQYPTGGGSLAWRADDKGFWYTRYPGFERPEADRHFFQQVAFHEIGKDPAKDAYVVGKEFPRVAEVELENAENPDWLLAAVANGDGGEFAHWLMAPDGKWTQVSKNEDKIVKAVLADDALYLLSRKDAPRGKVLRLSLSNPTLANASEVIPEGALTIDTDGPGALTVTAKKIFVRYIDGGPSRAVIFDHAGKRSGDLPLPEVAALSEITAVGDDVLYEVTTYLTPARFSRYDAATGKSQDTKLRLVSPVEFPDMEVVRAFAPSKDGTKVPLNIIRKKGLALDGTHPTLLYGYGGYGVNMSPFFLGATRRAWFDAGGVYVVANLRGGGEYGEEWHLQGNLTKKQNVFDDFLGSAQFLIDQKYTSAAKLAIMGGSNGGLLMGAAWTQKPELFRAVVSQVGIYDMLRVELDPNGSFNIPEFGTVKDEAQFRALHAYSPYHNVRDGAAYPAILMMTGENDGRVNPLQSRKMTARMQAANPNGRPVYLRTSANSGHGQGSSLSVRIDEYADYLSFLFDQLDMKPEAKTQ